MKKEEKFHVTQLFYATKYIGCDDIEGVGIDRDSIEGCNIGEADELFNPQILFDTSGAANAGTDNTNIYGVLCAEVPPFLEDFVQEQGYAGCCPGSYLSPLLLIHLPRLTSEQPHSGPGYLQI